MSPATRPAAVLALVVVVRSAGIVSDGKTIFTFKSAVFECIWSYILSSPHNEVPITYRRLLTSSWKLRKPAWQKSNISGTTVVKSNIALFLIHFPTTFRSHTHILLRTRPFSQLQHFLKCSFRLTQPYFSHCNIINALWEIFAFNYSFKDYTLQEEK
jgi:hypothetical protein